MFECMDVSNSLESIDEQALFTKKRDSTRGKLSFICSKVFSIINFDYEDLFYVVKF